MSDACEYRSRTSKGTIHMTNDNVVMLQQESTTGTERARTATDSLSRKWQLTGFVRKNEHLAEEEVIHRQSRMGSNGWAHGTMLCWFRKLLQKGNVRG